MTELPKAPVKRFLEKGGARRVSDDAIVAFRKSLENVAKDLTKQAIKIANREGRKTIRRDDILRARRAR